MQQIHFKNMALGFAGTSMQHPAWGGALRKVIEDRRIVRRFPPQLAKREKPPFQILVYHRVLQEFDPFAIGAITVAAFEQHMAMLSRIFRLITIDQLECELENDEVRPYTICLTFDDGYRDNFEQAFPLLRKYSVPATIFLTTDFIGTDEQLWHDRVLFALQNAVCERLSFDEANLIDVALNTLETRRHAAFSILEWLKQLNPEMRDRHISRLYDICRVAAVNRRRMMLNWNEVRSMQKRGIAFGAHTKTHTILTTLDDQDLLEGEIAGSKSAIEEKIQAPVSAFAYPNGKSEDFNESAKQLLKHVGFRCAVTTNAGVNTAARDRFEWFRTLPWDHDPNRLLARLLYERFTG